MIAPFKLDEYQLPRLLRLGTSLLVLVLGLALGLSFVGLELWEHHRTRNALEEAYQQRVAERFSEDSREALGYLGNLRESTENSLRDALRAQVDQAMATISGLYAAQHGKVPDDQLRRLLREALREVRFFDGRGYYFIDDSKGMCVLLPIDAAREGRSLWDNQDDSGHYVMRVLAAAAAPGGGGFASYRWYAPDSPRLMRDKLAYVARFEPFDWIVGAGDYLHHWEAALQKQALTWLRAQRVGGKGYYLVMDRSGKILLAPDDAVLEGQDIYAVQDPVEAVALRDMRALALHGGGRLDYRWSSEASGKRYALVSSVPGWDWILVTSQPVEEVEGWLQSAAEREQRRIVRLVFMILGLVCFATVITLLLSLAFSRRVDEIFTRYRGDLENRNRALEDSQGLMRAIFDAIPDLMWLKDRNGVFLASNKAFGEYYGANSEQISGHTDYDFVDRDTADFFQRNDLRAIEQQGAHRNDEWVTYPDGRRVLLETVKTPVRNTGGLIIGVLGIARDITLRRVQERELADSRALQALVVTKSPLGIALFRVGGTCVLANQALGIILDESADKLERRELVDFPLWQDKSFAEAAQATLASGYRRVVQTSFTPRSGKEIWLECQFNRVERDGEPHLLLLCSDITERRAAEEQLRLAASVFEHSQEGITITDANAHILDVNPTFCAITGFSREEVLGSTPAVLRSGMQGRDFYGEMWRTLKRKGFWRGEIWNRRKNGEVYAELLAISAVRGEDDSVSHYVGVFSDITLVKEQQRRLDRMAYYDALTQLPNRALLADRMQQAIAHANRDGHTLAICYLDLDGFKPVNDTYGHDTGDRLLLEVAQRLKQTVREDDTVARLGGDEFVLLLADLDNLMECETALQRVLQAVATEYALEGGGSVRLTASLGVTFFPGDSEDPDTLLRHADQAMYQAKQEGRNCFHVFDTERHRQTRANRALVQRLEQALSTGEFRLHYQPKVDMRHHIVVGAEALLRWEHPEQGLLLPAMFLPVLSQSALIREVGDWVLEQAVTQAAAWYGGGHRIPVSINVTGPQMLDPAFVSRLQALLEACPQLPPRAIELEILESSALEDVANIGKVMERCRALGVSFALDDFGTGYSTLTYLRRLPADVLKIDQTFVRGMLEDSEDLAIVKGVIGLARAFRRGVIAEGVETAQHEARLVDLGCDFGQGFGIAHPMAADEILAWVDAYHGHRSSNA